MLPVVLFHAGFASVSGGFLGVDIFFVISGFLITSIILNDLRNESFTLSRFYERRARRILPALFLVILFSAPVAFLVMPPDQFKSFVLSIGSVALFLSNFFFWQEFDYFAVGVEFLPMVHTWSLGVEEQFYIFFPLLLMLGSRVSRRFLFVGLLTLGIVSLSAAQLTWQNQPMANFYLLPFRIWELLIGALGAMVIGSFSSVNKTLRGVLAFAGVCLIFYSVAFLTEETPTPSLYTLYPTIGTLLVILFADQTGVVGRLLSLSLMVWIGKLSYSIYLWHQPVFAFTRIIAGELAPGLLAVVLVLVVIALAALTYRYVEKPFRDLNFLSTRKVFSLAVSAMSVLAIFAAYGYEKGFDNWFYDERGMAFLENYKGRQLVYPAYREECNYYLNFEIDESCLRGDDPTLPITLIWGDSHAQALAVGLRRRYGGQRFFAQLATSACRPSLSEELPGDIPLYGENARAFGPACRKANAAANQFVRNNKVESIVFHINSHYSHVRWQELFDFVLANGVERIFLVGPVPQWDPALPQIHALRLGSDIPRPIHRHIRVLPFEDTELVRQLGETYVLDKLKTKLPVDLLCRSPEDCTYVVPGKAVDDEDALFSFDYGHLSLAGTDYFAQVLFDEEFSYRDAE